MFFYIPEMALMAIKYSTSMTQKHNYFQVTNMALSITPKTTTTYWMILTLRTTRALLRLSHQSTLYSRGVTTSRGVDLTLAVRSPSCCSSLSLSFYCKVWDWTKASPYFVFESRHRSNVFKYVTAYVIIFWLVM